MDLWKCFSIKNARSFDLRQIFHASSDCVLLYRQRCRGSRHCVLIYRPLCSALIPGVFLYTPLCRVVIREGNGDSADLPRGIPRGF